MALLKLDQEGSAGIDQKLIKRNQDDQYDLILELGRHELTFNSLQQNLLR